jgi:hypothetical protein
VIPELLEANALLKPEQQGDIPFATKAERREATPRGA